MANFRCKSVETPTLSDLWRDIHTSARRATGASEEANIGSSFYNALQTSLVRRFSHGLTVNFNYVWSHMTDNVDGTRACVLSIFATPEPCWYDQAKGTGL